MLFDFLSFLSSWKEKYFFRGNKKVFQKIGLIQDFKQTREAAVGFGKLNRLKSKDLSSTLLQFRSHAVSIPSCAPLSTGYQGTQLASHSISVDIKQRMWQFFNKFGKWSM
ncbi:hypothetical protein ABPG74_000746 [Tetrahymena malaccensis]